MLCEQKVYCCHRPINVINVVTKIIWVHHSDILVTKTKSNQIS